MVKSKKTGPPVGDARGPADNAPGVVVAVPEAVALKGKALLATLAASLRSRGVPDASYIMINVDNAEFVTGKTPDEVRQRFAQMHPGATGWLERCGDVMGEPIRSSAEAAEDEEPEPPPPPRGTPGKQSRQGRAGFGRSFVRRPA